MSLYFTIICDKCNRKTEALNDTDETNGFIAPRGWGTLFHVHDWENFQIHYCPSCISEIEKQIVERDKLNGITLQNGQT